MYCTNCGYYVSEELSFCSNCGTALREIPKEREVAEAAVFAEPPAAQVAPVESAEPAAQVAPVESAEPAAPAAQVAPAPYTPPIPQAPPQKEKLFFGKGAFAFCLAVIAVLSIISGMFIGLYINEKNRSPVNSSRGGDYHSKIG